MKAYKLKFLMKAILFLVRWYCWFRQPANKERIWAALFMIPGILLLVPTFNYSLTMLQSFLFQAMLAYGLLSIFWIFKRHYRVSTVNFVVYFLLLVKVNTSIGVRSQFEQGDAKLKVMQFNVLSSNTAYDQTIENVKNLSPDFISFQEVSNKWADELEAKLADEYPYFKVLRHKDAGQGIAVFSKFPLQNIDEHLWEGTANLSGQVLIENEAINFLTLHTRSPRNKAKWQHRNAHIRQASEFVQQNGGEFLVLGDFNTVPWDKRMKEFKASTDLEDSRKKFVPTFPAWNPFVAQIPIDYIFHSKGINCKSLDSVKITSDHLAIMGSYQF